MHTSSLLFDTASVSLLPPRRHNKLAVVLLTCLAGAWGTSHAQTADSTQWQMAGHDTHNTRFANRETGINAANVGKLIPAWRMVAGGEVTATPAVDYGSLYYPDGSGNLYKVNATTGAVIWQRRIASFTGATQSISRTTPAIAGNRLVLGTRDGYLLSVDKNSGNLLWKTRMDAHPDARVTASPVIDGSRVYVGVSSGEEYSAATRGYPCCSFRGSAVALDLSTGNIVWRTYMTPVGFSGAAIWSSTPVVDTKRNAIYVTTGNNYSVPAAVQSCVNQAGADAAAVQRCVPASDHFDSIVSLDRTTGSIKWAQRLAGYDTWTIGCGIPENGMAPTGNCQSPYSHDYDFASGANLFTVMNNGVPGRDLVGAGQKNGIYWALNPDNGSVVWSARVGPSGATGGIQWGSATDGQRVYVGVSNSAKKAYTLQPSGQTIYWGAWSALDAATGRILWQTPNPVTEKGRATGPITLANGVVYGASFDPSGFLYAFDAKTGALVWRYPSGGSSIGGAAVVGGNVYWGSGAQGSGGTFNNRLYRFRLP